ncbi:hypothetical protein ACFL5F_04660 [Planctomycetota bacterium]
MDRLNLDSLFKIAGSTFQLRKRIIATLACLILLSSSPARAGVVSDSEKDPNLIDLALQRFPKQTSAQKKLFQAVADGKPADYSAEAEKDNDPADANNWGSDRVIDTNSIAWLCTDKQASELVTHRGIWLKGARIAGKLYLEFAKISFPLIFERSSIPLEMNLQYVEIPILCLDGTHTGSINADGLKSRSVLLRKGFKANGEVRLLGAIIDGNLACDESQFINPNGHALNGDGLKVMGSVFMRYGCNVEGGVRLIGATIGGNMECDESQFINKNGPTIKADKLNVLGSVFLRNGFKAVGEVDLRNASIVGNLDCQNGQFTDTNGYAFNGKGLDVEGGVYLSNGFTAEGEVRLLGAKIGGNLECYKSQFFNHDPNGYALNGDRLNVEGNVLLSKGFTAEGEVCLINSTIGSNLQCNESLFINPNGHALEGGGLKVVGSVLLDNDFKADGEVGFAGANIGKVFLWRIIDSPKKVELDLRSAKIGILWDDPNSWPGRGKLLLHGLVYDQISENAPSDAKRRIKWLRLQYDEKAEKAKDQFRPQPYEQLAAVLRRNGRDADAKKILIAKNEDKARFTKLTLSEQLRHRLFGLLIAYGYRPWRALKIGLVLVLLGWLLFGAKSSEQVMKCAKKDEDASGGFCALVYSFDVFVPLVDLRQASYWLPNTERKSELIVLKKFRLPVSGKILRCYMWIQTGLGWILTMLLVAGLTGLVRT